MRPELLLDVEVPGEPQLSPDGAQVLYLVTRPRLSPDGYAGELWVVPAAGTRPRGASWPATRGSVARAGPPTGGGWP